VGGAESAAGGAALAVNYRFVLAVRGDSKAE
jgi:hypothetical protein